MKNKNVLCCINDYPLFSYNPISNVEDKILQQVIINFITGKNHRKKWLTKETTYESNIEFIYFEVNVEKAFEIIRKKQKIKGTVENFCLKFLNYFLQDSPEPLIEFLKSTETFNEKDLNDIRKYFK